MSYPPSVESEGPNPDNQAKPTAAEGEARRQTVLIVEDDDQVRAVARTILKSAGYHVLTAANATQALAVAAEHAGTIHLLLTDVLLPCMSGRQLARRLTQARPGLRVMYVSGYPGDLLATRGVLDESAVLLEKPFRVDDMLDQVQRILREPARDHDVA